MFSSRVLSSSASSLAAAAVTGYTFSAGTGPSSSTSTRGTHTLFSSTDTVPRCRYTGLGAAAAGAAAALACCFAALACSSTDAWIAALSWRSR